MKEELEFIVLRAINDDIYKALFGKTTMELIVYFKLPPESYFDIEDNNLRDCLSELAVDALREIEESMADYFETHESHLSQARELIRQMANEVAIEAKAKSAGRGIDLLTGFAHN